MGRKKSLDGGRGGVGSGGRISHCDAMPILIITEKTSQARDLRAALGDRYGQILSAEGHLLRLAEPHEVNAAWKSWGNVLLQPPGLYPTHPASGGSKSAKLGAIAAALKQCDQVILATDCDREGQLIGQEILEHLRYRGHVRRALFTAQDPKSLRQAFDTLKPNRELQPLYEAAVARQQADQIFNLSLTRTATRTLLTRGTKGVIGIGRVKTPTLAIVCLREIEVRDFKTEDYFEIVATATVAVADSAGAGAGADSSDRGTFLMRHAPPQKARIRDAATADSIAKAAARFTGPLAVSVEDRRQAPPKLFDLPSLQKTCGQRWGWGADKTLAVAQELYDGNGKKVITYPRAEARYLTENQIGDVPAIVAAMTRLRGFAHLHIEPPVIRRGRSGVFCDAALAGVSHHAIVPNVNVMDDIEARIARLSDDEKRLFALVCRSYLAAVMPDYEYRQTVVTMQVPLPAATAGVTPAARVESKGELRAEFRAVGRIPLQSGWKAAFGAADRATLGAEAAKGSDIKGADAEDAAVEGEQTLPQLRDGQPATLSRPRVQAKQTQPPPRYSEGTLVDAMQNAWRFVKDEALRDRLKEAKGIGTPATRAEIIKGLKRQNLLMADGKLVVPTPAGLHVFELLRGAAPALVDPGTTAVWEMRLDDVVLGKAGFRSVIDEIAGEARRLIAVLCRFTGTTVDLSQAPPTRSRSARPDQASRPQRTKRARGEDAPAKPRRSRATRRPAPRPAVGAGNETMPSTAPGALRRTPRRRSTGPVTRSPETRSGERMPSPTAATNSKPPTEKMIAFATRLAKEKNARLPSGYDRDFDICRRFLDQQMGR